MSYPRQGFSSYSLKDAFPSRGKPASSIYGSVDQGLNLMGVNGLPISNNRKETMQGLNERLARYLEKVRNLEESNQELERKIKELMKEKCPKLRDYTPELDKIHALNDEVRKKNLENARIMIQIDNAKLALDDFKNKYDQEASICNTVEKDCLALKKMKADNDSIITRLNTELDGLKEELSFMQKNHKDEMSALKPNLPKELVTVEVDHPEGPDLNAVLNDLRQQYEAIVKRNKDDAESWYQSKTQTIQKEVDQNTEAVQNAKNELSDKRRTLQSLELELETLRKQINMLDNTLGETNQRYGEILDKLQNTLKQLELELGTLRSDMQNNKLEYEKLLQIKQNLEAEIATYRRLLEGEELEKAAPPAPVQQSKMEPDIRTRKIVKVVTQTMVNGKIVDETSEVEEVEEQKK
ncbi:keratin, type I cytoskeletal 18 isoform X1 [Polypterus senegalus]|nr:keratin, type I cytoskeletal 18 isoform X1 [Polypterus senegalus]XP_039618737.1 keratin, type I cytoskeletal 18 isoform X1 [Polypterus senegalus]